MMRAQQSFGAGLILTIGGVCKGCHHRPSCRPIIIITRNNSNTERRDPALKHLSLYLLQLLLCSLSLSLSLYPQWQENNFSRFFFPFGNINQVIDLPLFHSSSSGSQALPNCVCSPTERGGGAQKTNPKILSSSFSSQHLWLQKIAKGSTFFFYFSHKRERERESGVCRQPKRAHARAIHQIIEFLFSSSFFFVFEEKLNICISKDQGADTIQNDNNKKLLLPLSLSLS